MSMQSHGVVVNVAIERGGEKRLWAINHQGSAKDALQLAVTEVLDSPDFDSLTHQLEGEFEIKVSYHVVLAMPGSSREEKLTVKNPFALQQAYRYLVAFDNQWPGRNTPVGQSLLGHLRHTLAKAESKTEEQIQVKYEGLSGKDQAEIADWMAKNHQTI